jgi:hypothetical protein
VESSTDSGALRINCSDAKDRGDSGVDCVSSIHQNITADKSNHRSDKFVSNSKFKIYRPICEQGMPSELTAAVLNLPRREGDGGEKGSSASANLNLFKHKVQTTQSNKKK